jgi:hypothetical protein
MVAYYYNIKHDKDTAVIFNNKILEVDPSDATALTVKAALDKIPSQKQDSTRPSPPKKPE